MKAVLLQVKQLLVKKVSPIFILGTLGLLVYLPIWVGSVYVSSSQIGRSDTYLPILGSDSFEYVTLASNLSKLGCFSMSDCFTYETFRTPGYPLFIFLINTIFASLFAVTFIQCVLALIVGYLIYKIVLQYTNSRFATYASIFFLLEPSVVLHSIILTSDISYIFFITLAFYILIKSKPNIFSLLLIGVLLGISVLFRPISLFLLPIYFVIHIYIYYADIKQSIKVLLVLFVGLCLAVLPWVYRNYYYTGSMGVSSVSSYNLIYYNIPLHLAYVNNVSIETARKSMEETSGLSVDEWLRLENSKKISTITTNYFKDNFFSYGYYHIIKTTPFFFGSSIKNTLFSYNLLYSNDIDYVYESGSVSDILLSGEIKNLFSRLLSESVFFVERLLWVFSLIIGLCGLFEKKFRKLVIICWLIILYFAILTGPVSYVRYRLPAEPFLFIAVTLGLHAIYNNYKK